MGTRDIRSRGGQTEDQSQQIQVRSMLERESPGPGEVQVGIESPDPGEAQMGTKSLGRDEAQVRTRVTRYT